MSYQNLTRKTNFLRLLHIFVNQSSYLRLIFRQFKILVYYNLFLKTILISKQFFIIIISIRFTLFLSTINSVQYILQSLVPKMFKVVSFHYNSILQY
jgi:hypothetical protein